MCMSSILLGSGYQLKSGIKKKEAGTVSGFLNFLDHEHDYVIPAVTPLVGSPVVTLCAVKLRESLRTKDIGL